MKRSRFLISLFLGLLLLTFGSITLAQSEGGYTLRHWLAYSGGMTTSQTGGYILGGTAGQFATGTLNAGAFTLHGGSWGGSPGHPDANAPPTISDIDNQSTTVSTPISVTFTISDTDDALEGLWLYAESSDLNLVNGELTGTLMTGGGIRFSGSGMTRTITITPSDGITGTATITTTVDDSEGSDTQSFIITVEKVENRIFLPLILRNAGS